MRSWFLLLAAAVAAPMSAQSGDGPRPAPSPTAKPKLICQTETELGSRLSTHRRCLTAAEWQRMSQDAADDLDRRVRGVHTESGG